MRERSEPAAASKFSALSACFFPAPDGPTGTAVFQAPGTAEIANDPGANSAEGSSTGYLDRLGPPSNVQKCRRLSKAAPTLLDCYNLASAVEFAKSIGLPLNAFLTIWWKGFPSYNGTEQSADHLQRVCLEDLYGRLERDGVRRAAVWSRERVPGHGLHSHILLHIGPHPKQTKADLLAYLMSKYLVTDNSTFDIRLGSNDLGYRWPAQWMERLRYMLKPTHHGGEWVGEQTLGAYLDLEHDKGPQGFMSIKRAGTTQSIGPTIRARAGWDDISTPEALKEALHPLKAAELKAQGYAATPTGYALMRRAA